MAEQPAFDWGPFVERLHQENQRLVKAFQEQSQKAMDEMLEQNKQLMAEMFKETKAPASAPAPG